MTLRCRKGDMALVTTGPSMGKIVDVLEFVGTGNLLTGSGVQTFRDLWEISHKGQTISKNGLKRAMPDSWLIPIRPGDLDEIEETEKIIEFSEG